ncbi:MAG: hypothetical protein WC552_03585 [Candidatus Omnitrophota bacterium]
MSKNLIVVEFENEARYFLERYPSLVDGGTDILALLPESQAFLLDKGVKFHNSLEYFSKESHQTALNHVDEMMGKVNSAVSFEDRAGVSGTYVNAFSFYLRPYLSYIVSHLEIILNFVERHGSGSMDVCKYLNNDYAGYSLFAKERILGDLLQAFAGRCLVHVHPLRIKQKSWLRRCVDFSRRVFHAFCHWTEWALSGGKKRPAIVYYSLKYNFGRLARELPQFVSFNLVPNKRKRLSGRKASSGDKIHDLHLNVFGKSDPALAGSCRAARDRIRQLHLSGKIFSYRGIDFSSLVFEKIEKGFFHDFQGLSKQAKSLRRLLRRIRPEAVISPLARDVSFALGEISQELGIPSILISHGSHVPPKDDYDSREWRDHAKGLVDTGYQYHLLQTPWAQRFVEAMAFDKNYFKVAPLVFSQVGKLDRGKKRKAMYPFLQDEKIIVHAGTPKPRGSTRLYIYETMDEYIENIKDLIKSTRDLEEYFLIVRFRPSAYLSLETFRKLLPKEKGYVIAADGDFADYLGIADLLVSFSSTTIEEALLNKIVVLQYDRTGRYWHVPGCVWGGQRFEGMDSVYCVDDPRALKEALVWLLRNHFNQSVPEGLFSRHTFQPDEVMSVADFVRNLSKGQDLRSWKIEPKRRDYPKRETEQLSKN